MSFVFADGGAQLGNSSNLESDGEKVLLAEVRGFKEVILVNVVCQ